MAEQSNMECVVLLLAWQAKHGRFHTIACTLAIQDVVSRMRSGGFPCVREELAPEFATVLNRPQPSATVRGEAISVCHWDSSWKRVVDGSASAVFIGPACES